MVINIDNTPGCIDNPFYYFNKNKSDICSETIMLYTHDR